MLINLILNSKYYPILLTFDDFFFTCITMFVSQFKCDGSYFNTQLSPELTQFGTDLYLSEMLMNVCIFYVIMNEFL